MPVKRSQATLSGQPNQSLITTIATKHIHGPRWSNSENSLMIHNRHQTPHYGTTMGTKRDRSKNPERTIFRERRGIKRHHKTANDITESEARHYTKRKMQKEMEDLNEKLEDNIKIRSIEEERSHEYHAKIMHELYTHYRQTEIDRHRKHRQTN